MEDFIGRMTAGNPELREEVMGIYRGIFENSATDINKKQIAGWATCSQGIVPNEPCRMPSDPIVADLMKKSYASRFGAWAGRAFPGRTTLGMWGGTGPQNVNASTDTQA